MNEIMKFNIREDTLNTYQRKEVLVNNICPVFLPISIIEEENSIFGYTYTKGYIKLKNLNSIDIEVCFHILEKVISNIKIAKDYLFFPGEYVISTETMFYNMSDGNVRFAYSPLRPEISEQKQILYVVSQLEGICDKNAVSYLDRVYKQLSISKMTIPRLINFMKELKSEYDIILKTTP